MTGFSDLELYSVVARRRIIEGLSGLTRKHWDGDVLVNRSYTIVLARIWSRTWQIVAPNRLRREVRRPTKPTRLPPWSRQNLPSGALLFVQARARSRFIYVGEIADSRYFGHGVSSGGRRYSKGWTDYKINPALPEDRWIELRSQSIAIDDRLIQVDREKPLGPSELSDALKPIHKRRRISVTMFDRARGTLTYTKRGDRGDLVHESGGLAQRARTTHAGQGSDALFIYWEYGELSPYVRWTSRLARTK